MLAKLQRLLRRVPLDDPGRHLEACAYKHDWSFKRVHDGSGYVLEGRLEGQPVRLEWGPPQRNYIEGKELRLRCELGLPESLHMLVMTRNLADRLEDDAYARLTDGKQTVVKLDLPEESRWLTLYNSTDLDSVPMLGSRLIGVASVEGMARRWIEGDLGLRLLRACTTWLEADRPLVVMTLRGRVYLRTQVRGSEDGLGGPLLDSVLALAEAACQRALHVAGMTVPVRAPQDGAAQRASSR
ncbi:MAG: hypothetical protein RLZZ584_2988 [Pseudomonadota bacterium]|jgi:hypothetical protein